MAIREGVHLGVLVTRELKDGLQERAREQDRSVSWIVRQAVSKHLAESGVKTPVPEWDEAA